MYSKDIFLERAQQALLDGAIVFVSFLAAALLRHGGTILNPEPGRHFEIGPYLFPATILAVLFVVLFRYERLYRERFGRFAEAVRLAREIGRPSCRERVEVSAGGRSMTRTEQTVSTS